MLLTGAHRSALSSPVLGHSSVRVTDKRYSPWVRAHQLQPEMSV
jgi:hypothetical protein